MSLLWFRRSRRDEEKPELETGSVAPDPPARQAPAPRRIRNLLLLNLQPAEGPDQIERAPPLGSRAGVVSTVMAAVPGMEFTEGRGELAREGDRVTIDLGRDDPVYAAVAAAEGEAGIDMLRGLLQHARWRAYAPRAGVFVDDLDLVAVPDAAAGGR